MTHFRVRAKRASLATLRLLFRDQVVELGNGSACIPKRLGQLEERELLPIVVSLADKARQCVEYDRKCDRIARARG